MNVKWRMITKGEYLSLLETLIARYNIQPLYTHVRGIDSVVNYEDSGKWIMQERWFVYRTTAIAVMGGEIEYYVNEEIVTV